MKKTRTERYHKSIILVGLMVFILPLFIGLASAEELTTFDNIKNYDAINQKVTIENTFGIGRTIADIKLNTPLEVVVPAGYQKVAEFTINSYDDSYTDALNLIEFQDINDGYKNIDRQFDYKIKINKSYIVNDTKLECNIDEKNSTEICKYVVVGNHTEYKETWEDFTEKTILKGEYTISIWTYVNIYDKVEWIPTYYGIKIDEWASYVQSSGTKTYMDIGGLNYTIYTFTSTGYFNSTANFNASILVVAGGGGGGAGAGGGGAGGGGGVVYNNSYNLVSGNYVVAVGTGGAGVSGDPSTPLNGTSSSFDQITAIGGGGGGLTPTSPRSSSPGGSGGGTGSLVVSALYGNSIQTNNSYGFAYGNRGGNSTVASQYGGGGGGGSTSVGVDGDATNGGNGGAGVGFNIYNGTTLYYGGGGGGGLNGGGGNAGTGGLGGGGNGGKGGVGTNAVTNSGGGGGAGGGGNAKGGDGGSGIVIIRYLTSDGEIIITPQVTLNTPTNNTNTTNPTITFNITATDEQQITNVTLYIDGIVNVTDTSGVNGSYQWVRTLSQGVHNWSILAYNNNSNSNQSGTRFLTIDSSNPSLDLFSPSNTTYYLPIFETINNYTTFLNWSANDTHKDKCWYSMDDGATNTTITCSLNTTKQYKTKGNYTYIFWVNDTFGLINSSRVSFEIADKIFENGRILNVNAYETDTEYIAINLTANSSLTNVWLSYNGTNYSATQSGTIWNVTKMIRVTDVGNNTLNWTSQYAGVNYTTNKSYQIVSNITFMLCDGVTYTVPYLNISYKDEGNSSVIKAKVPSSTFTYYLGNGTINKTYLYSTSTEDYNHTFCFSPPNRTVNVDVDFQYSGGSYPQRIYSSGLIAYTNTTTNKTLYLLGSASGLYVTYQVVDGSETPISDVYVNASRTIGGANVVVGEGLTGSDGGITFWLNPDYQHTVKFSKSGYDDYTISHFPTQTLYTIQLSGTTTPSTDYTNGITIWITPQGDLINDTIYNFSSRIKSSYWTITNWGFNLKNSTGFYYYNTSSTSNGGLLQQNINTSSNTTFVMELYYLINSTYTNYTYIWTIQNTLGDDWSIKVFANDLKTYLGSGMFGLTNFGLSLIIFFIIILGTGIMSYKFGFSSPAAITGVVFGIVFILDFGLGLMDNLNPINAVSHTPTIFVGLVLIAFIIREAMSNQ